MITINVVDDVELNPNPNPNPHLDADIGVAYQLILLVQQLRVLRQTLANLHVHVPYSVR